MFSLAAILIFGFISLNNGYEVPIPRGQTQEQYFRSIASYWTPERMASATPLDIQLTPSSRIPVENDRPILEMGPEKILSTPDPLPTRNAEGPRAAGKVFFRMGGLRYMCSASVINAKNRALIVTAAHCVYNTTSKQYATEWTFMPHYDYGETPHGNFVARILEPTETWKTKVDYDFDIAVAVVARNEQGELPQDVAGAFGVIVNSMHADDTVLFGYPANNEQGEVKTSCTGKTAKTTGLVAMLSSFEGLTVTCGMNGGSSGGPWVRGYNPNTGAAFQVSVTSFGSSLAPGKIHGPHFTDANFSPLFKKFENA